MGTFDHFVPSEKPLELVISLNPDKGTSSLLYVQSTTIKILIFKRFVVCQGTGINGIWNL